MTKDIDVSERQQQIEGKIYSTPSLIKSDYDVLKHKSLGNYLLNKLKGDQANITVFTDFNSGRTWTGAQLHEKILNVATALVEKHCFRPGTTACIAYDNTDKTHILALGIICAGGVVACSYPKDPYVELLYLARKVEPKFLFCHEKNRIKWGKQLSEDLGYNVVAISVDGNTSEFGYNLESLMAYDHKQSNVLLPPQVKDMKKQVAMITMSSGTTGKPKAVPVTHWNCVSDLVLGYISRGSILNSSVSFACCASLDYVSGRLIILGAINSGYNAVILDGFDPETYASAIEKFHITTIFVGAASFYNFIKYPNLHKYDISSVRLIFPMGAKIVYLKELGEFLERHPNIREVRQGFGASEIGGAAMNSLSPSEYLNDCENCGRVYPGISIKIVDQQNDGKLLGPNQIGIVHIKGETIFPGYYDKGAKRKISNAKINGNSNCDKYINTNNDDGEDDDDDEEPPFVRDSSVFDTDGFYITGDLGYFNDKDELYIIGRQKELMSCRGAKKVLPQELEEILADHPAVFKICVLGIQSKINSLLHCPRAFVAPKQEFYERPEMIDELKNIRPIERTLNDDLNEELKEMTENQLLKHEGNENTNLCSLPLNSRRKLVEDLMEFTNERVGWEKQLTGGIVLLDEIPTSKATGKMDKNYLRALTLNEIEIFGDQSH